MTINKSAGLWIITERAIRLLSGIFLFAAIARHLGPQNFGNLSVALGILAILAALPNMGADNINISEIKKQNYSNALIGSAILVRLALCIPAIAAAIIISLGNSEISPLIITSSTLIPIAAINIINHTLLAHGNCKSYAKYGCIALTLGAALKIYGITSGKPTLYFSIIIPLESLTITTLSLKKIGGFKLLIECVKTAKKTSAINYAKLCKPTAVSAILVGIYLKIELILIGYWLGGEAAGKWAIVVLCITPWTLLSAATLPILNSKLAGIPTDSIPYQTVLTRFIQANMIAGALSIPFNYLFYKYIISNIMGNEFRDLENLIAIASISIIPILLGAIQEVSIAHRRTTYIVLKKAIIGIPFSIISLKLMTSHFGLEGAAISFTASYFFTAVLLNIFFDKHFHNALLNSLNSSNSIRR